MRILKTKLVAAAIMAFLSGMMIFCGCTNKCKKANCLNGGVCSDGGCSCKAGFTGENCQDAVIPFASFAGIWKGNNCEGNASYTTSVSNDTLTLSVPYLFTSCGGTTTLTLTSILTPGLKTFQLNTLAFFDTCRNEYVINAHGMLVNDSTLQLTFTFSGTQCVFTGAK